MGPAPRVAVMEDLLGSAANLAADGRGRPRHRRVAGEKGFRLSLFLGSARRGVLVRGPNGHAGRLFFRGGADLYRRAI